MKKLKIGVLMGGPSSEREVSLVTGEAIAKNLDRSQYLVTKIEMTREGHFVIRSGKKNTKLDFINKDRKRFDCIFIALHGSPGEDGGVQGMFETLGIAYTGSGVLASALAMDKVKAAELYQMYDLPTPDFVFFDKHLWHKSPQAVLAAVTKRLHFPIVLKPRDQGSAVGVTMVRSSVDLKKNISALTNKFINILAQECVVGREATCGVLEINGVPTALPPTHIVANKGEFYNYSSKYKPGGSTHICPADFPASINKKIQALAVRAHQALGCRGMSRTDIFYAEDSKLWLLETNTIPGMTPTSLLPEAAAKATISFGQMLDHIIRAAVSH